MNDWTKTTDELPKIGLPVWFQLLNQGGLALEMHGSFDGDYFVVSDDTKKLRPKFAPRVVARWRSAATGPKN